MQRTMLAIVGGVTLGLIALTASASTGTRSSAFEYDATTGLLMKEVIEGEDSNLCLVTTYAYADGYGNRTSSTTRNCNGSTANESAAPTGAAVFASRSVSSAYVAGTGYPAGQFPTSNTDALGHSETKTFDPRFGGVLTHTDPNAVVSSQTYDVFGRPSLSTKGDGTKAQLTYNFCSGYNGGTATCPALAAYVVKNQPLASDGVTANGPWSQAFYDILGRVVSAQTLGFDGSSVIVVATTYDQLGHVVTKSRPYYSTGTAQLTTFKYDSIDRVILQTNPDTSTRSTAYNGLTTTVVNELTQSKSRTVNSQGQLLSVTDDASQTMTYIYDPFNNLAQTTDPLGNVVSAYHDIRGRKLLSIDLDIGTWSYTYDALGQLVSQTNSVAQTSTLTYDLGGRLTGRAEPDLSSTFTYDSCTNGIGKLCSATSTNGYSRVITYDTRSRPLSTTTTTDAAYVSSVTYDTNGRVATESYPGGITVNLGYTALSYLQTVTDATSGTVYWKANTADAEGHITALTYGNGVATTNVFDPKTGWLQTSQAGTGGAVVNIKYVDDSLGNVKTRQDFNQSLTETFIYDDLNRLKSSSVNSTGAGIVTLTYTYDAAGNLQTRSDVGTYTYSPSRPHAVASIAGTVNTSFTYDNDGRMKTGNGRTITYTSFDMPLTISQSGASDTFVYGPEHQRMKRTSSTTTTVYVNPDSSGGLAYEKDMTSAGVTTEERVFLSAGGDPVVMLKRANGTGSFSPDYLHRDSIGSTIAITNSAGALVEQMAYEPFGKRRLLNGKSDPTNAIKGVNSDRGFTDHEHLDDLTLIHMNGRVYDPLLGRFLSGDPNIQFQDDLQSYNRFSYVSNNPLNTRDPTGYFSLFDGIATVLGAVAGGPVGAFAGYELNKATTQYLASHQWAYTIAQIAVAAGTAEYCGGCGSALLSADVSYAQTGSYRAAFKAGAITYASSYAYGQSGNNIFANAAIGCATAAASGGKCGQGALAAGFAAGARQYGGTYARGLVAQAAIGGTASVLGGGTFANGAMTASFSYIYSGVAQSAANGQNPLAELGDFAGKIWALPSSVIGLAVAIPAYAISWADYGLGWQDEKPGILLQHNALEFTNNVAMFLGGAMTFGNVELFARSEDALYGQGQIGWMHEWAHTIQAQILGPLYLPLAGASLAAGTILNGDSHGSASFMEVGPSANTPRPWPWH